MQKNCCICNARIGFFDQGGVVLNNENICGDCLELAGITKGTPVYMMPKGVTIEELKDRIESKKNKDEELSQLRSMNKMKINNFKPTRIIGALLFDDKTKTFLFEKKDLFNYDQILDFELLENGQNVLKGLTPTGLITGNRKAAAVCTSLDLLITIRNSPHQNIIIPYITYATEKDDSTYIKAFQLAQDTISALKLSVDMVENENHPTQLVSGADEILKYKGLLDSNIISQEEFEAVKARILGL